MLAVVTSFGVTFAILIFKLDTLVGGYSNSELLMQSSPVSVQGIINNPIDILPKIIHYLTIKFSLDSLYFHRISNVVLATISATGVYLIVKSWHTTRIAIITTALMITSGWFLHVARLGTYDSLPTLFIIVLLGYMWIRKKRHIGLAVFVTLLTCLILIYTPSLSWFVLLILIWQRKNVALVFKNLMLYQIRNFCARARR